MQKNILFLIIMVVLALSFDKAYSLNMDQIYPTLKKRVTGDLLRSVLEKKPETYAQIMNYVEQKAQEKDEGAAALLSFMKDVQELEIYTKNLEYGFETALKMQLEASAKSQRNSNIMYGLSGAAAGAVTVVAIVAGAYYLKK